MGVASVNRVDPSSPFLIRELLVVKLVSIKFRVVSAAIFRGLQLDLSRVFYPGGGSVTDYGLLVRIPYTISPNKF